MKSKHIDDRTLIVLDTSVLNKIIDNYNEVGKGFYKILNECKDNILILNTVYEEFYAISKKDMLIEKSKSISEIKKDLRILNNEFSTFIYNIDLKIKEISTKKISNNKNLSKIILNDLQELNKVKSKIDCFNKSICNSYIKKHFSEGYEDVIKLIDECLKKNKNNNCFQADEIIKICEEGKIRFENLLPPGFSDNGKKGYFKYNDLFIWKEILNYTKENKSIEKVIFLNEDMKEGNWWKETSKNEKRGIHNFLLNEFNSTVSSNDKINRKIEFMTITDFMGHYERIVDVIKLIEFDSDKIADEVFYVYSRELEAEMFNQIYNINPIEIDEEFYRSDFPEMRFGDLRLLNNGIEVVDDKIRCRLSIGLNISMDFGYTDNEGDHFNLGGAEVFLSAIACIDLKYKTDCQNNKYEIIYPDKIEETNFELKYVDTQVLDSKNLYDY